MKIYEAGDLEENSPRQQRVLDNRSKQREQRDLLKFHLRYLCSLLFNRHFRLCALLVFADFQIATIPCLMAKWVSSALVWICRDSII